MRKYVVGISVALNILFCIKTIIDIKRNTRIQTAIENHLQQDSIYHYRVNKALDYTIVLINENDSLKAELKKIQNVSF